MKQLIKFLLLVAIVVFALINYRIYSFDKGFSKSDMEGKSFTETLTTLANIQKVEYYEKTIKDEEYIYKVYIETSEDSYLFEATQKDIDSFKMLGIFSNNLQPQKVNPIPFYFEIIVGVIILFIPFGKKKSAT